VKLDTDLLTEPILPSPDVVARRVAGEYLLVPVRSGAAQMDYIFTANEIGSAIFRLLDGARDGRAIARQLTREFEVDEERAQRDVVEFLRALCQAGLAMPARALETR
jgi:hypothetical protein